MSLLNSSLASMHFVQCCHPFAAACVLLLLFGVWLIIDLFVVFCAQHIELASTKKKKKMMMEKRSGNISQNDFVSWTATGGARSPPDLG